MAVLAVSIPVLVFGGLWLRRRLETVACVSGLADDRRPICEAEIMSNVAAYYPHLVKTALNRRASGRVRAACIDMLRQIERGALDPGVVWVESETPAAPAAEGVLHAPERRRFFERLKEVVADPSEPVEVRTSAAGYLSSTQEEEVLRLFKRVLTSKDANLYPPVLWNLRCLEVARHDKELPRILRRVWGQVGARGRAGLISSLENIGELDEIAPLLNQALGVEGKDDVARHIRYCAVKTVAQRSPLAFVYLSCRILADNEQRFLYHVVLRRMRGEIEAGRVASLDVVPYLLALLEEGNFDSSDQEAALRCLEGLLRPRDKPHSAAEWRRLWEGMRSTPDAEGRLARYVSESIEERAPLEVPLLEKRQER